MILVWYNSSVRVAAPHMNGIWMSGNGIWKLGSMETFKRKLDHITMMLEQRITAQLQADARVAAYGHHEDGGQSVVERIKK